MDVDDNNPLGINSFHVNNPPCSSIIDLNKKRKLEDEKWSWRPISKHKFGCRGSSIQNELPFEDSPETGVFNPIFIIKGKTKEGDINSGSEHDQSGVDSNSLVGESDSPTSAYIESKVNPNCIKSYSHDHPSTSCGSFSRAVKEELPFTGGVYPLTLESDVQNELGPQIAEDHLIEHCSDEACEDTPLYSNGVTSNVYVLSSGRWSINQDSRLDARRPTIDQEFEQYFSMLML